MSHVEWQKVKDVFYTALNHSEADRLDFLDSACGDNWALRSEVEVLLDSYRSGFLESPLLAPPTSKDSFTEPLFEPGQIFSHYEILKLLGRGGMGEVYLANDLTLDRLAAIKVIHRNSGFGDQAAGRLVSEARAAAKLDHPNICSVYEVGDDDGESFIAMQYVEGEMLDWLIGKDSITFDDAVAYVRQIAAALATAHSWNIVHRDIKPSNIIIDRRNQVKVLDFGLAKRTLINSDDDDVSGIIAGTLTYMSPEHIQGQEINEQTDIWSLGVVFYQLLTGRLPFRGASRKDLMEAIVNDDFEAAGSSAKPLPEAVDHIFSRALQKDRSLRYATIEEFEADLAKLAETGVTVVAPRITNAALISRFAMAAVLLLAAGGFGVWQYRVGGEPKQPFSAATVRNLQTSHLYDLKRQINGVITNLSFSPGGQMIAFGLSANRENAIYLQPVSGGAPFRLTDGKAADYTPVWSPDGQRLAYLSTSEGKTSILSVSSSGGTPFLLANLQSDRSGYQLTKWSNDGRRIFFEYGDGPKEIDLYTGNISPLDLTGIEGKIARGFAVSPDESRLLAASVENGQKQLWVKSLNGNDARRIVETASRNGIPQWFPDNKRFAYSSDQNGNFQIYVRDIDDSQSLQVTSGSSSSGSPVVSPDGRRIVYITNLDEANIYSTDISSKQETVFTTNVSLQLFPSFSPDGSRIAYHTVSNGTNIMSGLLKIDSFDASRDGPTLTVSEPGCCARWSPAGDELAYVGRSGTDFHIWTKRINDEKETQITTSSVRMPEYGIAPFAFQSIAFDWSPDGSKVVFVSKTSGRENIWSVARNGSDAKMLTDIADDTTKPVSPIWSPAGDRIAFLEAAGTGPASMSKENRIVVHENGSLTVAAEFKSLTSLLCWSKKGDGIYVAVENGPNNDIYFVPANGSNEIRKIIRLPDISRFGIRISPDQKWIAYSERRDDLDNLYIVPMNGGKPGRLTSNDDRSLAFSGLTWSPDSTVLLYSRQTGGMQISLISHVGEEKQ